MRTRTSHAALALLPLARAVAANPAATSAGAIGGRVVEKGVASSAVSRWSARWWSSSR